MPADAPRYRLAPGVVVRPFDVAATTPVFLVEGAGGRRWEVSAATAALLARLGDGATLGELGASVAGALGTAPDAAQLARYVDETLVAQGMVTRDGDAARDDGAVPRSRLASLTVRGTLLPTRWAARAASPLAPLMGRRPFWPSLAIVAAASAWAWHAGGGARALDAAALLSPAPLGLLALGGVAHELGHVAAARRFGCAHGRVGVGLYLVFPVLFVELDDVWRLPRAERAIVDLAGLFVQMLVALLALLLALLFAPGGAAHAAATAAFAASAMTAVVNLNPAFRFDGYWLLGDALGVANLRRRGTAALAAVLRGEGRGGAARAAGAGALPPAAALALLAYAVASAALLGWWLVRLAAQLPAFVRHAYLPAARAALDAVQAGRAPSPAAALTLALRTALLAALGVTVAALVRHAARSVRAAARHGLH